MDKLMTSFMIIAGLIMIPIEIYTVMIGSTSALTPFAMFWAGVSSGLLFRAAQKHKVRELLLAE